MRSPARLLLVAVLLAISGDALADPPKRTIVDRVLAVVDEEPITLVELSARAAPYLRRIADLPEKERPAAEAQVRRDLLRQMIGERVVEERARELRVSVDRSDVDRALAHVAAQNNLTVPALIREAESQGIPEAAYRDELRRQILQAKLVSMEVKPELRGAAGDEEGVANKFDAASKAYVDSLIEKADVEVLP